MQCERTASQITNWSPLVIPGLLQTPDYARAIVERGRQWRSTRELNNFVELRMARQEALSRENPLHLWSVLDECALQREVGGRQVMKAQLEHLLEVTEEHENVALQILSFAYGAHAGIDGQFHLLHFPVGPPVVAVYSLTTSLYLEEDSDVGPYEMAFSYLRGEALSTEASQRYIHDLIKDRYT